jgi:hypothetical protein
VSACSHRIGAVEGKLQHVHEAVLYLTQLLSPAHPPPPLASRSTSAVVGATDPQRIPCHSASQDLLDSPPSLQANRRRSVSFDFEESSGRSDVAKEERGGREGTGLPPHAADQTHLTTTAHENNVQDFTSGAGPAGPQDRMKGSKALDMKGSKTRYAASGFSGSQSAMESNEFVSAIMSSGTEKSAEVGVRAGTYADDQKTTMTSRRSEVLLEVPEPPVHPDTTPQAAGLDLSDRRANEVLQRALQRYSINDVAVVDPAFSVQ